jgi:hypothetical protein
MFGKVLDACATITKRFFWKIKFAQCCRLQNSIVCQKFGINTVTLGRPSLCDPNLQSLLLSLRRSSARRSLRLLKTNQRPARPMKEPSVPALPARKRKRVRPQGRPRAAGPTKAARRIRRLKTTLVPAPTPWLLRKAVADIDIVFGGGCTLREQGPGAIRGLYFSYGYEFASSPSTASNTPANARKPSAAQRSAGSNRSATPGNLSQWKPQCACPVTYCKSGPVQSLGDNLGGARTEDEIAELFIPFGRPRPSWRTVHFPLAFSPSAIVSA